jgi:hypothetical protein
MTLPQFCYKLGQHAAVPIGSVAKWQQDFPGPGEFLSAESRKMHQVGLRYCL